MPNNAPYQPGDRLLHLPAMGATVTAVVYDRGDWIVRFRRDDGIRTEARYRGGRDLDRKTAPIGAVNRG